MSEHDRVTGYQYRILIRLARRPSFNVRWKTALNLQAKGLIERDPSGSWFVTDKGRDTIQRERWSH